MVSNGWATAAPTHPACMCAIRDGTSQTHVIRMCLEPIPPHLHCMATYLQLYLQPNHQHSLSVCKSCWSSSPPVRDSHVILVGDNPIVSCELASYPGHSWNRNLWTAYIEDSRIQQTWLSRALKMRLLDLIQTWSFDLELLQGHLIFGSFQAAPGLVSNPDLMFKTPNQGTLCNVLAMVWNTPSFSGRSASSFLIACRQEWPGNEAYKHSRLEE